MGAGSGPSVFGGGPTPAVRRVFVIAGNYREFVNWCQANKVSRHDHRVVYLHDFTKIPGFTIEESKGDKVVLYGTYEGRMDWSAMVDELMVRWRD